jgi:pimeloyl-ACP methyl ester carboxylesterase
VRSLDAFLEEQNLVGVDMVGSSMGGRMVLELARRGRAGTVVSLIRRILARVGTRLRPHQPWRIDRAAADD